MCQIMIFILLLFTLSVTPEPAMAAAVVRSTTDYYLVSGTTADEIRSDLDMKTPVRENGTSYDAHTEWFVKWNFQWSESNGLCKITKIKTRVDVQYILPKLKTSKTLPKPLKQKWETYMKALSDHENGHRDIGVRAANEIEKEIGSMVPRRSCRQLETDANDSGDKIIGKFRRLEKEFDRKSRHGMNDGAMFP